MADFKQVVRLDGTVEQVPLTPEEITQRQVDDAAAQQAATVAAAEAARVKQYDDAPDVVDIRNRLKTATAAQIDTYIDSNVTDLASARKVLKTILKLLVRVSR